MSVRESHVIVKIQDDLTRRKTHPTSLQAPLCSVAVIMSEEDPQPGTSKDSTSFMDFDDVVEEGNDDHHQSNASIETPLKLDIGYKAIL